MSASYKVRARLWISAVVVLLLLGVLPQRYIPQALAPVVTLKGKFAGRPVRLTTPRGEKPEVPGRFRIKMDRGVCRTSLKTDTASRWLFSAGACNARAQVPPGSELVLDPQGNTGSYDILLGPEWHPLGPKTRRFVFIPMAIAMVLTPVLRRKFRSPARKLGAKRLYFLVGVAIISGAILYPVVHEFGHLLFGMFLGAKPDWARVVWTPLGGEEPHAAFTHLPEGAGPLMSAGGTLFPTFVALVLLAVWKLVCKHVSWYVSAALVLVPALWLLSTLGCLFELYGNSHMDSLAVHLGLAGPLRVLFSLSPLLAATAVYVWLWLEYRQKKLREKGSMET